MPLKVNQATTHDRSSSEEVILSSVLNVLNALLIYLYRFEDVHLLGYLVVSHMLGRLNSSAFRTFEASPGPYETSLPIHRWV